MTEEKTKSLDSIDIPESYTGLKDVLTKLADSELEKSEKERQYNELINMFLSRKDKRKIKKYKGIPSFKDRVYGRV